MQSAFEAIAALLLLVVASDAFTNAVEWVGAIYGFTRSAVGAVIAAIGSSLPETMVAIVALVVLHDPASRQVGIGAVLGAPFMLATVAFAVIGAIALARRPKPGATRTPLAIDLDVAKFGLTLFIVTFALVVGASFAPTIAVRAAASAAVVASYLVYLGYHFKRSEPESDETPPPLRLHPRAARPHAGIIFVQLALALVASVVASHLFVSTLGTVSTELGVSPLVVSLFLSPIATELPEALNVAIWMRRGLDELAIGNVLGAMMFQTSIASTIAMLATPWTLDRLAYAACAAAGGGALLVLVTALVRRRIEAWSLAACGALYVGYAIFAASAH